MVVFWLLQSNLALAGESVTMSYSTGNKTYFSFAVPDDWKVNVGFEVDPSEMPKGETPKPRIVTAMPNDGSHLWFGMWIPDNVTNIKEAKDYLTNFRGYFVQNAVTKKTSHAKINGMQAISAYGEGERDGKIVDIAVVLFQVSSKNVGIVIYIGPPESTEQHHADIKYMVGSIQPTKR